MRKRISAFFVLVFLAASAVHATPNAWLSAKYYTYSPYTYSCYYKSPITNGFMDLMLFVDNVTMTDMEFSVVYDSNLVEPISSYSIQNLAPGLSVNSVINLDLEGSMKKALISLSGDCTIGTAQYETDSVLEVRFIPIAEGTMPVGLWKEQWTKYPDSYQSCSLSIENSGETVEFERKEFNDQIILFTFTDKADATLFFQFDYGLGIPLTNGYLEVTYSDDSVQCFTAENPGPGNTIATEFGGYFISPQADAVKYSLILPGYYTLEDISLNGTQSVSHNQPSGFLQIKEISESGFETLKYSTEDTVLTVQNPGIGTDFASHQYDIYIINEDSSDVIAQPVTVSEVDNDSIQLTVSGGLETGYYYLYVYMDNVVLGSSWFSVSEFFDVTFTVKSENETPLADAKVIMQRYSMLGITKVENLTDENGQTTLELPGNSEWGNNYEFFVTMTGYENYTDYVEVRDQDTDALIIMTPAESITISDFADFSQWWEKQNCSWESHCQGFDFNYDDTVNVADLAVLVEKWLID